MYSLDRSLPNRPDDHELYLTRLNFDLIAGDDGEISKDEQDAYRRQRAALPDAFSRSDYTGNLTLNAEEVDFGVRASNLDNDFQDFNTLSHVSENFRAAAGSDEEITVTEWSTFLQNNPAQ